MNSKILASCAVVLCTALPLSLFADDLTQVYQQALTSDPTFKQAQATWLTGKENLTLAETGNGTAGSGLFPNLTASASVGRTYQKSKVGSSTASGTFDNGDDNYLLTLTQPIFNYATWKQIASARYGVKAATATYLAAAQTLMSNVASKYFLVLQDSDTLNYDLSSKKAYLQALVTAEQKFKVGLIPVTGVYDAQASYDGAVADEIKDRNAVANDLEDLRAITGKSYQSLNGLRPVIPLVVPSPADINQWVKTADRQNYGIKSSAYTLMSAGEDIKAAAAGRYPTLAGQATWGTAENGTAPSPAPAAGGAPAPTGGNSTTSTTTGEADLNLNFPVFQGGYVFANTKQKHYMYQSDSAALELEYRTVMSQTRQAYLGVQSGISKINADYQAIKASREKLKATRADYIVGTGTMVNVLDAVKALYLSKETWADDRYAYINSIISLKENAGTLSPTDLVKINRWLSKPLAFNYLKTPVKVSHYGTENYMNSSAPSKSKQVTAPAGKKVVTQAPSKSKQVAAPAGKKVVTHQ